MAEYVSLLRIGKKMKIDCAKNRQDTYCCLVFGNPVEIPKDEIIEEFIKMILVPIRLWYGILYY